MKSKFFTLTAAVLTLALLSTVAVAMRSNEVEYTYFNAKGKVVGGKTYHCAGGYGYRIDSIPRYPWRDGQSFDPFARRASFFTGRTTQPLRPRTTGSHRFARRP